MEENNQEKVHRLYWILGILLLFSLVIICFMGLLQSIRVSAKPQSEIREWKIDNLNDQWAEKVVWHSTKKALSVIHIWDSFCPACQEDHKKLLNLSKTGKFHMIGILYQDDFNTALQFLKEASSPYTQLSKLDAYSAIALGVYQVPETFVIDNTNNVRWHSYGRLEETDIRDILALLDKVEEVK